MNIEEIDDEDFDLLGGSSLILNDEQLGLSLEISDDLFQSLVEDSNETIDLELLDELANLPDNQFDERLLFESLRGKVICWLANSQKFYRLKFF